MLHRTERWAANSSEFRRSHYVFWVSTKKKKNASTKFLSAQRYWQRKMRTKMNYGWAIDHEATLHQNRNGMIRGVRNEKEKYIRTDSMYLIMCWAMCVHFGNISRICARNRNELHITQGDRESASMVGKIFFICKNNNDSSSWHKSKNIKCAIVGAQCTTPVTRPARNGTAIPFPSISLSLFWLCVA